MGDVFFHKLPVSSKTSPPQNPNPKFHGRLRPKHRKDWAPLARKTFQVTQDGTVISSRCNFTCRLVYLHLPRWSFTLYHAKSPSGGRFLSRHQTSQFKLIGVRTPVTVLISPIGIVEWGRWADGSFFWYWVDLVVVHGQNTNIAMYFYRTSPLLPLMGSEKDLGRFETNHAKGVL